MPAARRSASKSTARSGAKSTARSAKSTARSAKSTARSAGKTTARSGQGVRARAAARSSATRREVEQSIARFEKRLDEANDALKALGGHLGTGARGSYKDVSSALSALRRNAVRTNKQALKDFDKLRQALTKANASSSSRSSGSRASGARSTSSRSTSSRSSGSRSTGSRSTSSRAKKS